MSRHSIIATAILPVALSIAGCGKGQPDGNTLAPSGFMPPATQAPAPIAGPGADHAADRLCRQIPARRGRRRRFLRPQRCRERAGRTGAGRSRAASDRRAGGDDDADLPTRRASRRLGCEEHNCGDHNWTVMVDPDAAARPRSATTTPRRWATPAAGITPAPAPNAGPATAPREGYDMLEHIPALAGQGDERPARRHRQAGGRPGWAGSFATLTLTSPAFADGARLPDRFTADGEGVSPPLIWSDPPAGTARLVLIVEDADAPTPQPLVHAIIWGSRSGCGAPSGRRDRRRRAGRRGGPRCRPQFLSARRLAAARSAERARRASLCVPAFRAGRRGRRDPGDTPGRSAVVEAMAGHVLAAGLLIGTYSRDERLRSARSALGRGRRRPDRHSASVRRQISVAGADSRSSGWWSKKAMRPMRMLRS